MTFNCIVVLWPLCCVFNIRIFCIMTLEFFGTIRLVNAGGIYITFQALNSTIKYEDGLD